MKEKPIILIQVGTPPEDVRRGFGDLPLWFARALNLRPDMLQVVRVFEGEQLPRPDSNCSAIVTGSWSMVTDRKPWSEKTAEWIQEAIRIEMPLFGVCYGHQLMAHALGGIVDYHPKGREIGSQTIELLPEANTLPMLRSYPQRFQAHLTHMQTIIELPPGARALGRSQHDPHQIVQYGRRAISTQFHPEFTAEIMAAIINARTDSLRQEGLSPEKLLDDVSEASAAAYLLRDFLQWDAIDHMAAEAL